MKKLVDHIVSELAKKLDTAVIGMSGGADSTLVAILLKMALGKENVYSVHMPYGNLDYKKFNKISMDIANHLGLNIFDIPITEIADSIDNSVPFKPSQVNSGNSRSRARMTVLYSISHELSSRVIGTGNLSEDFIGYDTKAGDAMADLFPIGELYKSEVYKMLDYFIEQGVITENMVDRHPSAGLWEGQSDEDELGYTYNQMEDSIKFLLGEKIAVDKEILDFVKSRHENNKHKHEAPLVISLKGIR